MRPPSIPTQLFGLLRLALATALLLLCLQDGAAMRARTEFAALPEFDFVAEAEQLLSQRRYSEALLVTQTGLASTPDPLRYTALVQLRGHIEQERDDWGRRLRDAAGGALRGGGDSVEALSGALLADLFVFGDLRDLVVQGGRAASGQEVDEVILGLSTAGLLLTAVPGADLGTALLKFARRLGALSERLAQELLRLAREASGQRRFGPLLEVGDQTAELYRRLGPGPALSALRHMDEVADLTRALNFARRPGGGFALWLGGRPLQAALKDVGRESEDLYLRAAYKGPAGLERALRDGGLLLRAHPLAGLLKGIYKGHVPQLLQAWLLSHAEALLGFAMAWFGFELLASLARAARMRRPRVAAA